MSDDAGDGLFAVLDNPPPEVEASTESTEATTDLASPEAAQDDVGSIIPMETRPNGVPDKFWKEGEGLRLEAMLKSEGDLRKKIGDRPQAAEDFTLNKFEPELREKFGITDEDPLWTGVADVFKKYAVPQGVVDEVLGVYASALKEADSAQPDDATLEQRASEAIRERHGDKAEQMVSSTMQWLTTFQLDDEQKQALKTAVLTDPQIIDVLNTMYRKTTNGRIPDGGTQLAAGPGKYQQWADGLNSPEYAAYAQGGPLTPEVSKILALEKDIQLAQAAGKDISRL